MWIGPIDQRWKLNLLIEDVFKRVRCNTFLRVVLIIKGYVFLVLIYHWILRWKCVLLHAFQNPFEVLRLNFKFFGGKLLSNIDRSG